MTGAATPETEVATVSVDVPATGGVTVPVPGAVPVPVPGVVPVPGAVPVPAPVSEQVSTKLPKVQLLPGATVLELASAVLNATVLAVLKADSKAAPSNLASIRVR